MQKTCVVGLSGGVDSSVAAFLLKQKYHVVGCSLKMRNTFEKEIADAEKVANTLGIEFEVIDCVADFKKCVIDYFAKSYRNGLTPNPCVICNRSIKFKILDDFRRNINANLIATGHYAQIIESANTIHKSTFGKYLQQGANQIRDQSYFLYSVDTSILSHTEFPLGKYSKSEVRKIAYKNDLHVCEKSDSQDVCFIPDGDYKKFLASEYGFTNKTGDIVDSSGKVLGHHNGISNYTIGQRKGLGLAGGPFFVHEIDVQNNRIIVSEKGYIKQIFLRNPKFLVKKFDGECLVKIRSSGKKVRAKILNNSDGTTTVIFIGSEFAAAQGQHCVFFEDNIVLGGGEIANL